MDKKFNLETINIFTIPRSFQKDLQELYAECDVDVFGDSWDDYLELFKAIILNHDHMPNYNVKIKYIEDRGGIKNG